MPFCNVCFQIFISRYTIKLDLSFPICIIKCKLYNYLWKHFIQNFDDTNVHSSH